MSGNSLALNIQINAFSEILYLAGETLKCGYSPLGLRGHFRVAEKTFSLASAAVEHPDTGGLEMRFEGCVARASVTSCIIRGASAGSDISLGLTTLVWGFISTFRCQTNYNVSLVRLRSLTIEATAIVSILYTAVDKSKKRKLIVHCVDVSIVTAKTTWRNSLVTGGYLIEKSLDRVIII